MSEKMNIVVELFGTPQGRRANVLVTMHGEEYAVVRAGERRQYAVVRAGERPTKTTQRSVDAALVLARKVRSAMVETGGKEVSLMIIDYDAKERALAARKSGKVRV